jgi:hypothetical protein
MYTFLKITKMKKFILSSIMVALITAGSVLKGQNREEYLGLPGDNLNLYAVMQLFQDSKTLEEFERNLNDGNSNINNLDLNGDNLVDYIKVYDNLDGNVHNIVLQVAVGPRDNQDVAVFTVQRFNNGQVMIQLTGDEALYGRDYIIEPIADETPNPGYNGNYVRTTPSQIAVWPIVRFIYMPTYTVWHSNWYWGYYPSYWNPWRTYSWHYYYGYHYHWNDYYYSRYHHTSHHEYTGWNDYYYHKHRTYSPEVSHRISNGTYKTAYSHPEERRSGEEMFAKKHPDEYRKSTANHSSDKRSNPGSVNNSSDRRSSSNTETRKSSDSPKSFKNSDYSRRSSESVNTSSSVKNHSSSGSDNNFKNSRKSGSSGNESRRTEATRQGAPSQNASTNHTTAAPKSSGNEARKSESRQSAPAQKKEARTSSSKTKSESAENNSKKDSETKNKERRQ